METRHALHGKPEGSLAKLFRDFGDRWEIENVQRGTEWIAVDRETGGDYIRVISAHQIDTLRYRITQAEREEPEEREAGDQCGR